MTVSTVNMIYPTSDTTDSVQLIQDPTVHTISSGTPVNIAGAFKCKDNTLTIILTNSAEASGSAVLKKGVYPHAVLGDVSIIVAAGKTVVIKIENPSRFEQADGSLSITFSSGYSGTIYAFGKKAGLASAS